MGEPNPFRIARGGTAALAGVLVGLAVPSQAAARITGDRIATTPPLAGGTFPTSLTPEGLIDQVAEAAEPGAPLNPLTESLTGGEFSATGNCDTSSDLKGMTDATTGLTTEGCDDSTQTTTYSPPASADRFDAKLAATAQEVASTIKQQAISFTGSKVSNYASMSYVCEDPASANPGVAKVTIFGGGTGQYENCPADQPAAPGEAIVSGPQKVPSGKTATFVVKVPGAEKATVTLTGLSKGEQLDTKGSTASDVNPSTKAHEWELNGDNTANIKVDVPAQTMPGVKENVDFTVISENDGADGSKTVRTDTDQESFTTTAPHFRKPRPLDPKQLAKKIKNLAIRTSHLPSRFFTAKHLNLQSTFVNAREVTLDGHCGTNPLHPDVRKFSFSGVSPVITACYKSLTPLLPGSKTLKFSTPERFDASKQVAAWGDKEARASGIGEFAHGTAKYIATKGSEVTIAYGEIPGTITHAKRNPRQAVSKLILHFSGGHIVKTQKIHT